MIKALMQPERCSITATSILPFDQLQHCHPSVPAPPISATLVFNTFCRLNILVNAIPRDLLVFTELRRLREGFAAPFADERLLSGVGPDVIVEGRRSGERPLTIAAFEGLFTRMDGGMVTQIIRVAERLVAVATVVRSMGHARTYVNLQNRPLIERFATLTAAENAKFGLLRLHLYLLRTMHHIFGFRRRFGITSSRRVGGVETFRCLSYCVSGSWTKRGEQGRLRLRWWKFPSCQQHFWRFLPVFDMHRSECHFFRGDIDQGERRPGCLPDWALGDWCWLPGSMGRPGNWMWNNHEHLSVLVGIWGRIEAKRALRVWIYFWSIVSASPLTEGRQGTWDLRDHNDPRG